MESMAGNFSQNGITILFLQKTSPYYFLIVLRTF